MNINNIILGIFIGISVIEFIIIIILLKKINVVNVNGNIKQRGKDNIQEPTQKFNIIPFRKSRKRKNTSIN